MFAKSYLILLTLSVVQAQLNGEFWWLNPKLNKNRKTQPSAPLIEDISEFDTDESAKIVFRDNDLMTNKISQHWTNRFNKKLTKPINPKQLKLVYPSDNYDEINDNFKENIKITTPFSQENANEFLVKFPSDEDEVNIIQNYLFNNPAVNVKDDQRIKDNMFSNNKLANDAENFNQSPSTCKYIKSIECQRQNGIAYNMELKRELLNSDEPGLTCCVLPIQSVPIADDFSKIYFPDSLPFILSDRDKRSANNENEALKQRKFLLRQKFSAVKQKPSSTTEAKIVTPTDDYVDPYWNIKNSKKQKNKHKVQTSQYDYYSEDYADYTVELPKPGIGAVYSDHSMSPSTWEFAGSNTGFSYGTADYDDEDDEGTTFGYSTIDPRKGEKIKKHKTKPQNNAESQTISFQSIPDFQILQGFKLLNLVRNKSSVFKTNIRRTSTDKNYDSKELPISSPSNLYSEESSDEYYEEEQLFGACGKSLSVRDKGINKVLGEASNGSHPWMALVVLTKRQQNILCYATLIHPRVALTVADCVSGTLPKDITVIAGLWDLNDKSNSKKRVATVIVHPRHRSGEVDNNLALLHWMRPLKLAPNIQPACLSEPHIDDDCRFFGWGGLSGGIQPQSKWQKASIRACSVGLNKRGTKQSEAFCANTTRSGVTGMGGALICDSNGLNSLAGVVVSKSNNYVLVPVHKFAMRAVNLLQDD